MQLLSSEWMQGSPPAAAQLADVPAALPRTLAPHRFAQAFVDAAEAIGAGACITVVSVDATGGLVDSHKLHSSLNRRTTSTGGSGWGAGSDSIGSGGGGGGGGPTSSLALPAGVIQTHISFGAKQMSCYAYTPGEDSAGTWTADPTAGLWSECWCACCGLVRYRCWYRCWLLSLAHFHPYSGLRLTCPLWFRPCRWHRQQHAADCGHRADERLTVPEPS